MQQIQEMLQALGSGCGKGDMMNTHLGCVKMNNAL